MVGEMAEISHFILEESSLISREIFVTICIKALAEAVTAAHAVCLSIVPGLLGRPCDAEPCDEPETTSAEEYSPSLCKAHDDDDDGLVGCPDTNTRFMTQDVTAWIAVCKNKDDDDDDDEDDEDDEEEDGDGDEDEEAGDEDEGDEGLEGGAGNEDDEGGEDEDEDEDDDGKGDEDEEEEDGVEGEEEEDEDGVEDEDNEEDEDDDDEAPEPPQKKRK